MDLKMIRRIDKPKVRIKLTKEVFDELKKGNTFEFDREWMPYSIVLENWAGDF